MKRTPFLGKPSGHQTLKSKVLRRFFVDTLYGGRIRKQIHEPLLRLETSSIPGKSLGIF